MEKQNAASETEYWRAEVKKVFRDFFLLFVTVAVVLIAAGTWAWFASSKEVDGDNMKVSVQDGDFELMVRGQAGYSDEILPLPAVYTRAEEGESELVTGRTKQSIQWLVSSEYNINNYGDDEENTGILPGTSGKLIFWVVPKNTETLQVTFGLDLTPYRRNWDTETGEETAATELTEEDADYTELKQYIDGHILFFRYHGDDPAHEAVDENDAKYSALIRGSFVENITFSRIDGELQPYPITIYWIWPDTLGEALLRDEDLQRGRKGVCETAESGENELVTLFAEHPEQFLHEYIKPEDVTLDQAYVKGNYSALSIKYNEADQEIGDEISYILAEITATE